MVAQVLGGTHPRRDVTVSVDGQASTIVTRAGTVGDLLASEGIVLHDGDRVVPSTTTALEQGMPVHVFRAFPMTADVDGTLIAHRTTRHDVAAIRRELNVPSGLVRVGGHGRIARGTTLVLRTPHDVALSIDNTDTALRHDTALTVAELLAARKVVLGPNDQVDPALDARLADGTTVHVYRLGPDTVMEDKIIPFPTEYKDDPTLAAGHTATIQAGRNGLEHRFSKVVRRTARSSSGSGSCARTSSSRPSPRSCAGAPRSPGRSGRRRRRRRPAVASGSPARRAGTTATPGPGRAPT